MNFLETFLPILSLAAHGVPAPGEKERDARAIDPLEDLERLLTRATDRRRAGNSGYFDCAWLAVCACIGEKLGRLPRLSPNACRTADPGELFYKNLDLLLEPANREGWDPEWSDVLRLHALCLDLGFLGGIDRDEADRYRRRCREALREAECAVPPAPAPRTAPVAKPFAAAGGMAAAFVWIAAPLVVCGLFLFYRFLLSDAGPPPTG